MDNKMEKPLPEILACWEADKMRDIVGEKGSKEEYQAAHELVQEETEKERKNIPLKRLKQGILHLEKMREIIGDHKILTEDVRSILSNADRDIFFFLGSHHGNDDINESFSVMYEFIKGRDATFARKKVGKKYNGPFKLAEAKRTKMVASIEGEIDGLIKKMRELASSTNLK